MASSTVPARILWIGFGFSLSVMIDLRWWASCSDP
jgi:hypothetical protein